MTEEESKELPIFRELKKIWKGNVSHFSDEYKSVRHSDNDKRTTVYEGWRGMLGYLRFYLWMQDHNYQIGVTELKRIEAEKGFFPNNLLVVEKRKPIKRTTANTKLVITEEENPIPDTKILESYLFIEEKKVMLQLAFNMLEKALLSEQYVINLNQLKDIQNNQ